MDNLKLADYLRAVRHVVCLSACFLVTTGWQTMAANAADRPQLAQQSESTSAASAEIQKIQRLLKLLADRYPERYGSVDPGRLDGVLGEETKVAVRNFRKIAGLTNDRRTISELQPAILSELAQMTSADAGNPPAPEQSEARQSEPAPAPTPVSATEPADAFPAPATAPSLAQATKSRDADRAEPPRANTILYFVQVASLRSVESAEREWKRIKNENRAALEGEQTYLERADLRDRGIFHRILIGPMPTRDDATTLCGYLKQNDQTCVVTQRRSTEINKVDFRKLSSNAPGADKPRLPWEVPAPAETTQPALHQDSAMAPAVPPAKPADEMPAAQQDAPAAAQAEAPSAEPAGASETPAPATSVPAAPAAETPVATAPVTPAPAEPAATAPATPAPVAPPPAPAAEASAQPAPSAPAVPPEAPASKADAGTPATDHKDTESGLASAAPATTAETPPAAKKDGAKKNEPAAIREIRISVAKLQAAAAGAVVLALLLAGGFVVYRIIRHKRQSAIILAAAVPAGASEASPLSAMETERVGELESLSQLEEAFDGVRLQESRRVRDAFLRDVLEDDPDDPSEINKRDSAIRVNSSLKSLLASDPEQYKAIFLNLIFLSKVGAALNRRDVALEELNGKFSRELMLLQSYFKIHVLELDDRHRIRQELPGLFYCLQLSQLHQRQGNRHFSAA